MVTAAWNHIMGIQAAITALPTFTRSDPIVNDRETLEALEREIFNTSDRVTAVMLGPYVETALDRLLTSRMRPNLSKIERDQLFGFEGAVGTFSAKIIIAYAMNIIGPITYSDLKLIKELRNQFAHSRIAFDFPTPEVVAVCNELKIPKLRDNSDSFKSRIGMEKSASWMLFVSACHNIAYRMLVKREGPHEGDFVFVNEERLP
jgi:DNA-binding MltR family transcriptional regulator